MIRIQSKNFTFFRSAVLFSLKAFPLALDDIELAFEMGYPDGRLVV